MNHVVKRSLLILAMILSSATLLGNAGSAHAGGQRWSAWTFQPDTRTVGLFVPPATDVANSYVLPLPTGMTRIQGNVAISHRWDYMAYVASTETGNRTLVIWGRNTQSAEHVIPLPPQTASSLYSNQYDWQANENSFNDDSTAMAFGYAMRGGHWAIYVYSLTASNGIANLISEAPAVAALHIPSSEGWTPVVQRFSHSQVTFTMANGSTSLPTHYDSYVWDMTANTVTATNTFPMVNTDTLQPTGETVGVGLDTHFPRHPNPGSMNVIVAYDPVSSTSIPFYSTSDLALFGAKFIQNGERILFYGFSGSVPRYNYTMIERSGAVVGNLSDPNISDVIGWQDGLLYLSGAPGSPQTLNELNTRTGATPTVMWSSAPGAPPLQFLQTPTNMNSTGPFTAWNHLGGAASLPPAPPPSGPAGSCPAPRLAKGGQGLVTPGVANNIRSAPMTGSIIGSIPPGDVFDVLDGPICTSNGVLWWKISYKGIIGYTGEGQGSSYWVDPVGHGLPLPKS